MARMILAAFLPVLLLGSGFSAPFSTAPAGSPHPVRAQEEEDEAGREWAALQERLTPKLLRYREADAAEREKMSFHAEMALIGSFVRKHREREPDYADAARVYLAKEILSGVLDRKREAIDLFQSVVVESGNPLIAGLAAVHAGELYVQLGEAPGVRRIAELYGQREAREEQFLTMLADLEKRASLRPGRLFPELVLPCLDGKTRKLSELRGSVVLLLVFNVDHPGSLEQLRRASAASDSRKSGELTVVGISVDEDRAALTELLETEKVRFWVSWDGKGWQSQAARQLGVSTIPMNFVLSPGGVIRHVNVPTAELGAVVAATVEQAREAGELSGG